MTESAPRQPHCLDRLDPPQPDAPADGPADVDLLAAVAGGDAVALRHLYERHAGWVAARLRPKLPAHAVEDVLQETFLAVWRGAGRYGGSGDVGGWVWGIARRQMAQYYRKRGVEPDSMVDDWVPAGADEAAEATDRMDLQRAFDDLGDGEDRLLAEAYYLEDRPVREIAERFGIPAGTVKSRLFRLRRRLTAALANASDKEPGR